MGRRIKMVRRIISVLFAVMLVFGLTVSVGAENTVWYYSDDLGIAVPVSDGMSLLSRYMSADDPLLTKLGQTRETVLATFYENNVYLQLWEDDLSGVINISMTSSSLKDMRDFDETEWDSFITSILDEFDYADVSDITVYYLLNGTYAQFSIYVYNGASYIYCYYYVTVYQGKKIVIQLFSQSGSPTSSQQKAFDSFVGGIYYGTEEEIFGDSSGSSSFVSTSAFTYTDDAVDTSFTVPANWYSEAVSGTDPYVTAVFVSNEDEDAVIVYGSEDQWSDYSSLKGIARADINNDYFTEKEIEDKFEFTTDISVKYVDGVKYFTFKSYSGNMVSTSLIMYHNAVFYWFEFYGDENHPYYGDFISLIKSVKYPEVSVPATSQSKPASSQNTSAGSQSSVASLQSVPASSQSKPASTVGGNEGAASAIRAFNTKNKGLYIALAVVLFALPILIYRYAVRKRPVEPKRAMEIVLIYGAVSLAALAAIAAFLEGSWVAVGIVLIWHIASYFILTSGRKQAVYNDYIVTVPAETHYQPTPTLQWQQPTVHNEIPKPAQEPSVNSKQPLFCEMCGSKLKEGSKFCSQCGATVVLLREEGSERQ